VPSPAPGSATYGGRPGPDERSAVPPDASFAGLAAFATAGRDAGPATEAAPATGAAPPTGAADARDTTAGGASTEYRTEESD
jgi:hypothetical protein